MKHETKLTSREQQELAQTKAQQTTAREFAAVEELLRHDASQTAVPSRVAERLGRSIEKLPKPGRSWWRRWLGRD